MTQQEAPEESRHFAQVLTRLDALMKRNQQADETLQAVELDTPEEVESGVIPVLTEIYQGEASALVMPTEDSVLPLLTEAIAPELPAQQTVEEAPQPDAFFGTLANLEPSEAPPQITEPTDNYDEIVENMVATLMPQLQDALARAVREETARVLDEIQAGVAERMHEEIDAALRSSLRKALLERRD